MAPTKKTRHSSSRYNTALVIISVIGALAAIVLIFISQGGSDLSSELSTRGNSCRPARGDFPYEYNPEDNTAPTAGMITEGEAITTTKPKTKKQEDALRLNARKKAYDKAVELIDAACRRRLSTTTQRTIHTEDDDGNPTTLVLEQTDYGIESDDFTCPDSRSCEPDPGSDPVCRVKKGTREINGRKTGNVPFVDPHYTDASGYAEDNPIRQVVRGRRKVWIAEAVAEFSGTCTCRQRCAKPSSSPSPTFKYN